MRLVVAYLTAGMTFAALDAAWLNWAGERLYRAALGDLLAEDFRPSPAITFYVLYIAGLVWFAVRPGLQRGIGSATGNGAMLGTLCYMTYDLTNQATLVRWPIHLTLIDIAWGAFATASAATISTIAARRFAQTNGG